MTLANCCVITDSNVLKLRNQQLLGVLTLRQSQLLRTIGVRARQGGERGTLPAPAMCISMPTRTHKTLTVYAHTTIDMY